MDLHVYGGDEGNRTPDPLSARQVLSQLSYIPGGLGRVESAPGRVGLYEMAGGAVKWRSGTAASEACGTQRVIPEMAWGSLPGREEIPRGYTNISPAAQSWSMVIS